MIAAQCWKEIVTFIFSIRCQESVAALMRRVEERGAKRRVRGVDGETNNEATRLHEQQQSVILVALTRPQMAVVAVLAAHHKNGVADSGSAAALARRAHACHVVPRIAAAEAREALEAAACKVSIVIAA
jgi:hypothetical protein